MQHRLLGVFLCVTAVLVPATVVAQAYPPPLTESQASEIRAHIQAMKQDVRGPYLRIRWFCNDGTVHPPGPGVCSARGGGVQHAEFNDRAKSLAARHIHVGTILQAVSFDEIVDSAAANTWLRELILNRYLEEVDDGWVLRQARFYRGARQIEDEEQKGHAILEKLLANRQWTEANFFLASQLVEVVPHHSLGDQQSTQRIRNLATEVSNLDASFLATRIKIHSFPSRTDLDSVSSFLDARQTNDAVRAKLVALRDELIRQYDVRRNVLSIDRYRERLGNLFREELRSLSQAYERGANREAFAQIAALSPRIRDRVVERGDGRTNLLLIDLNRSLQEQAFVLAQDLQPALAQPTSRRERLRYLSHRFALAYGAGFLSQRERQSLDAEIARLLETPRLTALGYKNGLGYLGRSLDWGAATVRAVFGRVTQRYVQFEPKAAGIFDALVRGSALLPLAADLERLGADADGVLGASHVILGERVSQGVRGLNPGVALRTLEILDTDDGEHVDQTKIYVLPQTTAELRPVAGVLTMDEGNLLSHVQLLARNLGIPNAAVSPDWLPQIRQARGEEVFYAVSPLGRVFLKRARDMTREERSLVTDTRSTKTEKITLNTSRLRLDRTRPMPLTELRVEHSGVFVGPKAANLGQLGAYFPTRVSAGVALPFGMFYQHVNRSFNSDQTVVEVLRGAYRQAAEMRAAGRNDSEIDAYMFGRLEWVRRAIQELEWLPDARQAVADAVRATFGNDLSRGVFVRSDTNVEDLPEFSGAGLNLTVAHQRTLDDVFASIKRVWTSPFSERAYLWRKQILAEQGDIYPSVLLLESVPSEKSGVMITTGLEVGGPTDLTIVTAEGVGGGVDGGEAETIVVDASGAVRLLSQAKAPERRVLVDRGAGGVAWMAARMPDRLLSGDDIEQLRAVAAEWKERFGRTNDRTVWDIEFGFVGGKLWLFQIRPFVRFRSSDLHERLGTLDRDVMRGGNRPISLEDRI